MKILFVLENTMDSLEGGTEVSSRHLAGLLKRKGVEVEEWAPFDSRKPIFWYTSIFGQIYILIVLAWKLVKNRVNILHVQGKYLIPPVIILGKLVGIPTVVTIRDYIVLCPIGLCLFYLKYRKHGFSFFLTKEIPEFLSVYHGKDGLMIRVIRHILLIRGWLVSWWLKFWLKKSDAVVAVSKYVQRVLDEYQVRSEMIYNVFDPVFAAQSNKVRPLNTLVFVGKPSYGKGYDLFRSLSLNKEFKGYQFLAVGGDKKLPYLETLEKIRMAKAVVVPSRWPEPFGRVALEALMMGTPVVASGSAGLAEIVEDGATGVLAEPNTDSLAAGLKKVIERNTEFRKNILRSQSRLTEKFVKSPPEKHLRLYLSLLS